MNFELKLKDITWLGQAYPQKSRLSPFSYIQEAGFAEDDRQVLIQKKVLTPDGNIAVDYASFFNLLSVVTSYVIFKFTNGLISSQKTIYFAGDTTISSVTEGDTIHFEMPADNSTVLDLVKEMTGSSVSSSSDLDLDVDFNTALVFTTLVDLYRKNILSAYSTFSKVNIVGIDKSFILKAINENQDLHDQKLSSHVLAFKNGSVKISEGELNAALNVLQTKEIIRIENSKALLVGDGLLFGGSFLTIENYFNLIIGQEANNEIYKSSFSVIQAGIRDLLFIDGAVDTTISLKALSANDLIIMLSKITSQAPHIA